MPAGGTGSSQQRRLASAFVSCDAWGLSLNCVADHSDIFRIGALLARAAQGDSGMKHLAFFNSVVTRLILCLVLGGLLLSAGQTWLEYRRSQRILQMEMSRQVGLTVR